MQKALFHLIYDYSVLGKMDAKEYVENLVRLHVSYNSLKDYIKKIEIVPGYSKKCPDAVALYSSVAKKIYIFRAKALEFEKKTLYKDEAFSFFERCVVKSMPLTQIILHELEHAHQSALMKTGASLEADILRLSRKPYLMRNLKESIFCRDFFNVLTCLSDFSDQRRTNYVENYFLAPEERLAQVKSHQLLLEALRLEGINSAHLVSYEKECILKSYLSGYPIGLDTSPTLIYLENNGVMPFLEKLKWFDKDPKKCLEKQQRRYSLEKRLKYGLMIDQQEYEEINHELKLIKK